MTKIIIEYGEGKELTLTVKEAREIVALLAELEIRPVTPHQYGIRNQYENNRLPAWKGVDAIGIPIDPLKPNLGAIRCGDNS